MNTDKITALSNEVAKTTYTPSSKPKFTTKHMNAIAEMVRGIPLRENRVDLYYYELVDYVSDILKKDNPNFKERRFRKACDMPTG